MFHMNITRHMETAISIARDTVPFANAKIGAVLLHHNTVVAVANNNNPKTHPLARRYGKNRNALYPHAEIAVLRNAQKRGFKNWRSATLLIARVLRDGTVAMSKPCEGCSIAIRNFNIGKVYYTDEAGDIVRWNE